jgi:SAM-dependent methyltransferase
MDSGSAVTNCAFSKRLEPTLAEFFPTHPAGWNASEPTRSFPTKTRRCATKWFAHWRSGRGLTAALWRGSLAGFVLAEMKNAPPQSSSAAIRMRHSKRSSRRTGCAYTCSFSVAAALAGATTTNIDLSGKSLARGQKNFALNGLDASRHRFHAADVLDLLPRLARKKERFDAIILDPPTFSRGDKGRRFQVERDFENLLLEALEVAAPGARLLLSTNCARLTSRALETIARFCLKATRRSGTFHKEPAPFPDVPGESIAETLWLLLTRNAEGLAH